MFIDNCHESVMCIGATKSFKWILYTFYDSQEQISLFYILTIRFKMIIIKFKRKFFHFMLRNLMNHLLIIHLIFYILYILGHVM